MKFVASEYNVFIPVFVVYFVITKLNWYVGFGAISYICILFTGLLNPVRLFW